MSNRVSVSSAEFIRNIGYWQNEALRKPISITHHGRERLVLAAPDAVHSSGVASEEAKLLASLRSDVAIVLENLSDGYLSVDPQLCIRHSNVAAEAFVGLSRADLDGVSIMTALPQPLASILADRVQRVIRSRQAERFEVGAADGRHFSVTVFPVAAGAAALLSNVTEVHALRRNLEEGEALQQAVRAHANAAAIKLDARARIESVDASFTAWTGFASPDVTGHRMLDLVAPGQRRDAAEGIERVLREGQSRAMSLTLLSKRGDEIDGIISLAPIQTDFIAHGAFALFIPLSDSDKARRAA